MTTTVASPRWERVRTAVVLFTRDLRVHDNPALAAAARAAEQVVPLFVLDPALLLASANRTAFLLESLADLDASLRRLGSGLVVRRGDPVAEVVRAAAEAGAEDVFASADVSAYAQRRQARLARERLRLQLCPGVTVVPPGELVPAGRDCFRVFTPYWRRWAEAPLRPVEEAPGRLSSPSLSGVEAPGARPVSPGLPPGGETAGRGRLDAWVRDGLDRYGELHDDLGADATSRLGPYLHLGCVSPLDVRLRAARGEPFVRQLCWRDFFHQLLAAVPALTHESLRADRAWNDDPGSLEAWKAGRTGFPLVDAGMRQLAREGWMHNRARLVTGSFLTRQLGIDWRAGARHYAELLVDGDAASNAGNWQWVAGTGANPRPNRVLSPLRQARRFDPAGDYVRRHVPELRGVAGPAVHEPWLLPASVRRRLDYPAPIVDPGRRP